MPLFLVPPGSATGSGPGEVLPVGPWRRQGLSLQEMSCCSSSSGKQAGSSLPAWRDSTQHCGAVLVSVTLTQHRGRDCGDGSSLCP